MVMNQGEPYLVSDIVESGKIGNLQSTIGNVGRMHQYMYLEKIMFLFM